MNLLCVIPSYWPAFKFGGPIYSVHNLNKALVKKGIDVTVYTTNVGLSNKVHTNEETDIDGVKVTYFGFTKFFEFLGATGWQFSLPMTRALHEDIKKIDIIYILSVWNYPVAIASYYARKYKKPYIISPRGMLYSYTLNKKSFKKMPYYYLIAKRYLENASAIHYTTADEFEQCHQVLGLKNPAYIIPNGIDLSEYNILSDELNKRDRLNKPDKRGGKTILFLGRIHWIKGLDILIKAFAMLAKEKDDVHLLIVGGDEERYSEKVKGWIKEFGIVYTDLTDRTLSSSHLLNFNLNSKVTFTGMLKGREKLDAYAGSDIFVLPSYSESFGMAAVEAMACGAPVVISNKVGIYKEVEKNKAGIVVECNAESLYQGIKSVLDDENLAKELSINGKRLVEEYYDIDKVAGEYVKMYEGVLEGRNVKRLEG